MITRTAWIVLGIVTFGFAALGVPVLGWGLLGLSIGVCAWRFAARVPVSQQVFGLPGSEAETSAPVLVRPPKPALSDLSTVDLCAAWRRSYFELLRAVDAPVRERLVRQRQEYLDELERRDGAGFARWLANGARASSDPGHYLTTGS
jgi:hypothetical protein